VPGEPMARGKPERVPARKEEEARETHITGALGEATPCFAPPRGTTSFVLGLVSFWGGRGGVVLWHSRGPATLLDRHGRFRRRDLGRYSRTREWFAILRTRT